MTTKDTLDALLKTAETVLGEGKPMSTVVDGTSIPKLIAEYLGISETDVRATKLTAPNNVVNRTNYEALWKNPVVLCITIAGNADMVATLLHNTKNKVAHFAQYVPVKLGVVPRIRAALIITRVDGQPATLAYVATFSGPADEGAQPQALQPAEFGGVLDLAEEDEFGEDGA